MSLYTPQFLSGGPPCFALRDPTWYPKQSKLWRTRLHASAMLKLDLSFTLVRRLAQTIPESGTVRTSPALVFFLGASLRCVHTSIISVSINMNITTITTLLGMPSWHVGCSRHRGLEKLKASELQAEAPEHPTCCAGAIIEKVHASEVDFCSRQFHLWTGIMDKIGRYLKPASTTLGLLPHTTTSGPSTEALLGDCWLRLFHLHCKIVGP